MHTICTLKKLHENRKEVGDMENIYHMDEKQWAKWKIFATKSKLFEMASLLSTVAIMQQIAYGTFISSFIRIHMIS